MINNPLKYGAKIVKNIKNNEKSVFFSIIKNLRLLTGGGWHRKRY